MATTMEKKVLDVEGIKTEVLSMAAQEPDPTGVTIVVIPGNPGAIDFYVEFISELHKLCEQRYDIIGVGHAGHSPESQNNGVIFSLQDQIQHKISFLERLSKGEGGAKASKRFVLIGHSVGAFICLQVAKQRADLHIAKIINLFPTVHNLYEGLPLPVKKFRHKYSLGVLENVKQVLGSNVLYWLLPTTPETDGYSYQLFPNHNNEYELW